MTGTEEVKQCCWICQHFSENLCYLTGEEVGATNNVCESFELWRPLRVEGDDKQGMDITGVWLTKNLLAPGEIRHFGLEDAKLVEVRGKIVATYNSYSEVPPRRPPRG